MPDDDRPSVTCDALYPTLRVPDVDAAANFYRDKLGFDVSFRWGDPVIHAGVQLGTVGIHLNQGDPNPDGTWTYLVVDDLDGLFHWYQRNGVTVLDEPTDRPWGMREFNVEDINGYRLRFGQVDLRTNDPLPVERVDLSMRVESSLASLLYDLAEHKRMTLGELIEEIVLHSFEEADSPESVASPHTRRTHAYIADLKRKHGIDYETHDSYRFTEDSTDAS